MYHFLIKIVICLSSIAYLGCQISADHVVQAKKKVEGPDMNSTNKPWTRLWWMGNAVDKENLGKLLEIYAKAGFGGVEITPIYGAMGYEDRYLEYLSPEWMDALRFTTQKADELGMKVDMNLGTGWPFGGPQITPEHAASQLIVQTYTLSAGQSLDEKLKVSDPKQQELNPKLIALTAYGDNGETVSLLDQVAEDGTLRWKPENGNWELYAAFLGKTRQQVKRAAPGGSGYTMDHLSQDALQVYLQRFDEAFGENPPDIRAYFNDSYEVYNADLSPKLLDEFEKRRGYDVRHYLRELVSEEESDKVLRIKADYRKTMAEMLLENFTIPWTQWIHEHNAISRNQAHGSPGNLLDLYAAVDIPETETFGSTSFPIAGLEKYTNDTRNVEPDPVMMKFASSAANITGKPLVSSETFTWLGEHFKVSLAHCKPEVEQVFLAGINHVFFHGTTYSPEDASWPGWMFYASVNFAPSNSFWPHVPGLNEYIARCQSTLQSGKADNELMIYWPIHDVWYDGGKLDKQLSIHGIEEWLHPTPFYKNVARLMEEGYSLDFVSDNLLDSVQVENGRLRASENTGYKTLIIPASDFMPVETFRKVLALAEEGATVILEKLPEDVPGWHALEARRKELRSMVDNMQFEDVGEDGAMQEMKAGEGSIVLTEDVQKALTYKNIEREALTDNGLKFVRRDVDGGKYYYLTNHTADPIDDWIPLQVDAQSVIILNPQDGSRGRAAVSSEGGKAKVRVQMASGEALILQTSSTEAEDMQPWPYVESTAEPIAITGDWHVDFIAGGPELPEDQTLDQLVSWAELPDTNAARFSGTAAYTINFTLPEKTADEYLLKLGDVRESARVWVNDQEVGILWSVPFQAKIGQYLRKGENTMRIEVANLMANRIRDLDRRGVEWRKYHEINFVNLEYQPFDASGWEPQPSGLLGPVTIVPIHLEEKS